MNLLCYVENNKKLITEFVEHLILRKFTYFKLVENN